MVGPSTDLQRVMEEVQSTRRSLAPSQGRLGGALTRSCYASLRFAAIRLWGKSAEFPRSMDHTYPDEVIQFLRRHIALHERATKEKSFEYLRIFKNWITLCGGRVPLRMRRYLGPDYRLNVELRTLEREWAALGDPDQALTEDTLFQEMNLARQAYPTAANWAGLQLAWNEDHQP